MDDRPSIDARLRAKALACTAQREHSRVELRRKLLAHAARLQREDGTETSPALIDALLEWMAGKDLLSDARFVEIRVQARSRRFGSLRIQQELAQHGLQLDTEAAQTLQHSELARAHALWERRYGERATEPAVRARQMRFLMARGFSADVVRRIVAAKDDEPAS